MAVEYSGGSSGLFGRGFDLTLGAISRKSSHRRPDYSDQDSYTIHESDDLVPALVKNGEKWIPAKSRKIKEAGLTYVVDYFRTRTEGQFSRIERWVADGDQHWRVRNRHNDLRIYGKSATARIDAPKDPDDKTAPTGTFSWLLEEKLTAKGERTRYEYSSASTQLGEAAKPYLQRILYGASPEAISGPDWAFEVYFDYTARDNTALLDDIAAKNNSNVQPVLREDISTSYHAGFALKESVLCRAIAMVHHVGAISPYVVRVQRFSYFDTSDATDGNPVVSKLSSTQTTGYRAGWPEKSLPKTEFGYTGAASYTSFSKLKNHDGSDFAAPILNFSDIDLKGIPSVLHEIGHEIYHAPPLGNGRFGPSQLLAHLPLAAREDGEFSLIDLVGDGRQDLTKTGEGGAGYFERGPDGSWQAFVPFSHMPNSAMDNSVFEVDLTGDGLPDRLILSPKGGLVHASLGRKGYSEPTPIERPAKLDKTPEDRLPLSTHKAADAFVGFADIYGDGCQHLVRVRRDRIDCWPNLGYGRFGRRNSIEFKHSFGTGFNPARVHFVNTTGLGGADILYATHDRINVYLNQFGRGFIPSDPIKLPFKMAPSSAIRFDDLLGTGESCMVISEQGSGQYRHWLFDFCGGVKPHALALTRNNMGIEQRVEYATSTEFMLMDQENGNAWHASLPSPVWVVKQSIVSDLIAGTQNVINYSYHDGFFNTDDLEFCGFGYVETSHGSAQPHEGNLWQHPALKGLETGVGGVKRSWYHTGAKPADGSLSLHYRNSAPKSFSYFKVSDDIPTIPDSVRHDGVDIAEGYRALKGKLLRKEVYDALEFKAGGAVPVVASEYSYYLKHNQPSYQGNNPTTSCPRQEKISYHFERNSNDPRVEHTLVLDADEYDHPTLAAHIYYPRIGKSDRPEPAQKRTTIHLSYTRLHPALNGARNYLIGLEAEDILYNLEPPKYGGPPTYQVNDFDKYSATIGPPESKDLTVLTWDRHIFADKTGKVLTENGKKVNPQGLMLYTESAVLSESISLESYGEKLTPERLKNDSGYFLRDSYWWERSEKKLYDWGVDTFFQSCGTRDAGGAETRLVYSKNRLHVTKITDPTGCFHESKYDAFSQLPCKITDANGVVTEKAIDQLGETVATSVHGFEGDRAVGDEALSTAPLDQPKDLDDLVKRAKHFLGTATSRVWMDPNAWLRDQKPPAKVTLHRTKHAKDDPDLTAEIHITITYFDGFSRVLQRKTSAPAGMAISRDNAGEIEMKDADLLLKPAKFRWHASGFVAFNNRNKPVLSYEPFFTPSHSFERDDALAKYGGCVRSHFDALGRLVESESAIGLLNRHSFTAWEKVFEDENDTLLDAPRFKNRAKNRGLNQEENIAMEAAASLANTPTKTILDPVGNVICHSEGLDAKTNLETLFEFDLNGNLKTVTDPLGHVSLSQIHDMQGQLIYSDSAAIGESITLYNALGGVVQAWDAEGRSIKNLFDKANRPIQHVLFKDDSDARGVVIRSITYAKTKLSTNGLNMAGQPERIMDESGDVLFEGYTIKGSPIKVSRGFLQHPSKMADWRGKPRLLPERIEVAYKYDIDERQTSASFTGGSRIETGIGIDGAMAQQSVTDRSGVTHKVVTATKYSAMGARQQIDLGQGISRRTIFEPKSHLTRRIETTQNRRTLLANEYTYDPVGNISSMVEEGAITRYQYDGAKRLRRSEVVVNGRPTETESFCYDDTGNMLSQIHTDTNGANIRTNTYAPASNRLTHVENWGEPALEPKYDRHGNMKALTAGSRYRWDPFQRLRSVDLGQGGPVTWFQYDSLDHIAREVVVAGENNKHKGKILSDRRHLGPLEQVRTYSYGTNGAVIEKIVERLEIEDAEGSHAVLTTALGVNPEAGSLKFTVTDHLKSTRISVDGDNEQAQSYFAFGEAKDKDALQDHERQYGGEEYLADLGFYNYGARFYAPELGRWINPDLSGMIDGLNLYSFVSNNPIRYRDFGGHALGDTALPQLTQNASIAEPAPAPNPVVQNRVTALPALAAPTQAQAAAAHGPNSRLRSTRRNGLSNNMRAGDMSSDSATQMAMSAGAGYTFKSGLVHLGNWVGKVSDATKENIEDFHDKVLEFNRGLSEEHKNNLKKIKGAGVAKLALGPLKLAIDAATSGAPLVASALVAPLKKLINSYAADKHMAIAKELRGPNKSDYSNAMGLLHEVKAENTLGNFGEGLRAALHKFGGGIADILIEHFDGEIAADAAARNTVRLAGTVETGLVTDRPIRPARPGGPTPPNHRSVTKKSNLTRARRQRNLLAKGKGKERY